MSANKINNEEIHTKLNEIDSNIQSLNILIETVNKKNKSIQEMQNKLCKKNFYNVKDSLTNLDFQKDLLLNEERYIKELRIIFLERFYNELYLLAENILMFLNSIDSEEFKDTISKEKIVRVKEIKHKELTIKNLLLLTEGILNNLEVIHNTIEYFNKYILDTEKTIKDNNFHCKTFEVNLQNQKEHIELEFIKFSQNLIKILEYYHTFSQYIFQQVDNQKILEFCTFKKIKPQN